jgi:hypothetical protein
LPTTKPSAAFSPVLGKVRRSCPTANSCVAERMRGTVLRKLCTVSVPWPCQVNATFSIVVSDPRSHHRRCGLEPDRRVTGSAVLPSLRVRPLTRTSRARDGSKDAEVPWKRRGSPLGLLSCGCRETASVHMGIMRSRYERSFFPIPSRRFVCLCFCPIGGYFARKIGAVIRVSVRFLTVDSPSRVKYADGPSTTPHGLDNCKE